MSAQEDSQDSGLPTFGATQTTIDQMEDLYKAPDPAAQPPAPAPTDDIPDQYKGKSVKELIAQAEALQRAMIISEQGRVAAMRQVQGPAPEAPPPPPKEFTREELAEMMGSDDPGVRLQAVDIMNTQAIRRAEAQVAARFNQLHESTAASAEMEARRLYPKEFELFGDQIYALASQVPDRAQLGNVSQWRNLISFVRGQDQNVIRYAQALSGGGSNGSPPVSSPTYAREIEAQSAGFTPAPIRSPNPGGPTIKLDPFTIEIAKTFGRDPVEYAREIAALDK